MINVIILIIAVILLLLIIRKMNHEKFVIIPPHKGPVKWSQVECSYGMSNTFNKMLKKNNFKLTTKNNWNVLFPCSYDNIDQEIKKMVPHSNDPTQRFYIIDNAVQLAGKNY